ncbi:hypothetical protein NUSPORA_00244 [Nucleospora cyclopteri]
MTRKEKKLVTISQYIEYLLKYMNIPYFKNNPTYIEHWRKFYEHTKDPNVLLLLFNKRISTCYHWIYVEFSKIFIEMGKPEVANFIIKLGIQSDVFDQAELKKQLLRIPEFKTTQSDKQIYQLFKKKKITCMGRIFDIKNSTITKIEKDKEVGKENIENQNKSRFGKTEKKVDISTKEAHVKIFSLEMGEYLVLDKISLFLKSPLSADSYQCINLVQNAEETVQSFCLINCNKRDLQNIEYLIFYFHYQDKTFAVFHYNFLCFFTNILKRDDYKTNLCKYFYLEKIIKIAENFPELPVDCLYVDCNFDLKLYTFTGESSSLRDFLLEELNESKENNFNSIKNALYAKIDHFQQDSEYKNDLFKHKSELLNE